VNDKYKKRNSRGASDMAFDLNWRCSKWLC